MGFEEEMAIFDRRELTQSQITGRRKLTKSEVKAAIFKDLRAKKAPGHDLITGQILKELLEL